MGKYTVWKWLLVLLLLAASMVLVTPPREKINLGLDLQGGTAFVAEIDRAAIEESVRERLGVDDPDATEADIQREVSESMRDAQGRALEVIRNRIDGLGIAEPAIYPEGRDRIVIQLPGIDEEQRDEAERSIRSVAFLEFRMVHVDSAQTVSRLFDRGLAPEGFLIRQLEQHGMTQSYYVIEDERPLDAETKQRIAGFQAPRGAEMMLERAEVRGQTVYYRPHYVKRRYEMSGDALRSAKVDFQEHMQPIVALEFTGEGRRQFARLTTDYAPGGPKNPYHDQYRALAIILDNTLYSAPIIQQAIRGGNAVISGRFDREEAAFLANVLRAGTLPAPVTIIERRIVDPSLGADSIRAGITAIIIGGILVVLFMAVYYTVAGLVANLALIMDILLLPLGMVLVAGFLGIFVGPPGEASRIALPVLTLPGIAGILLTIGMAVDANVLIFERIREEMKAGRRLAAAISPGYDKAFVAIFDANVTTFLTAVILFLFGTGPIRGFAITLCAGILVSMFTAIVFTRMVFDLLINKGGLTSIRMFSFFGEPAIDFMSKRRICLNVSVAVIVATIGIMSVRGLQEPSKVFGVDFTGGASSTFRFEERPDLEDIRSVLVAADIGDVHPQFQESMELDRAQYLNVNSQSGTGNAVREALQGAFPDSGLRLLQEDDVGPRIGDEMKRKAAWAILWALAGIILYISWRFEFGFALGAIAALGHDVLLTLGLYSLFGLQLNLPTVAALLTIVGYSVNDTIVVFDRIREDLRSMRGKPLVEVANLSINQTLSRTVLTSLTTLMVIVMLLVFGGGAVFDFALALFIGVLVGTYSSIFVATPTMLWWYRNRKPVLATKAKA